MPRAAKANQQDTHAEQAPGTTLKGKFKEALCDAVCDKLDIDGLAQHVAGLVAPKVLCAVHVDKLAEKVIAELGDGLAEELAASVVERIVGQ